MKATIPMVYSKDTKRTFVYTATDGSHPIQSVYINKAVFGGMTPQRITLTLESEAEVA